MKVELGSRVNRLSAPTAPEDKRPLSICIVAHNAYGALTGHSVGYRQIGGVQKQTALMARWLTEHGHCISVVTWDEGQEDSLDVDGIRILKLCRPSDGIRGLRFFYPRLTSLYRAMRRASADIYYHNSAESITGLIAAWCSRHRKSFVYSAASESDCDPKLPMMSKPWERLLFRQGLRSADRIIVQSIRQRRMLAEGSNLSSVYLPMPSAGPATVPADDMQSWKEGTVVWVGRVDHGKRLEWFLEIAVLLPDVHFQIVGANTNTPYARSLYERASKLPNIAWLGSVPWREMGPIYERAACLCCTSAREGFPNTFLEAWSYGKPVVSTFDPDQLIKREGLGITAQDVPGLAAGLKSLLENQSEWQACGRRARKYFDENHQIEVAMRRFESELLSVASARYAK